MKIQMCDLVGQYKKIEDEVDASIKEVLSSASFINGSKVAEFSEQLNKYLGASAVVPCANGTDALQIALMALGLEPGDEVILPVFTYVATAEVIALLGLKPVFVDVEKDYFTIDVTQLESLITDKTKAIVPVHLYGQCADMESIMQIAVRHNLFVVEDTAQALGAEYSFSNGVTKKAGTIGHIGCTSFFPSKNLGCYGDGGAMIFNDQNLAKKAKMIANHGQSVKYVHDIIGCNSRLDTIQAAVLNCKLPHLDSYAEARNKVADYYDKVFKFVKGVRVPQRRKNSTHVFHQYTLTIDQGRDNLKEKLQNKGIPSMIYYPIPLHKQKAYEQKGAGEGVFPITENLCKTVLSLPIHTEMDDEQLKYICDNILELLKS